MSGLCGWIDTTGRQDSGAAAVAVRRMADELAPARSVEVQTFRSGSLATEHGATAAAEGGSIVAAIAGKPRWRDRHLESLARDRGDAEALLVAYRERGTDLLNQFGGSFAIAVLDLDRRRAVLAIDRMGIRPMCFAQPRPGILVFGSTATSVAAHPDVGSSVANESLYRYFYFHVVPSPATIFSDVSKLEPGQCVIADDGNIELVHYWFPDANTPVSASDERTLLADLRDETRAAVARSAPDTTTACFLSGGLDSSTISGLANEVIDSPILAYTIGFDQQGYDETEFARAAAMHFGLDHVEYYVTPDDVAGAFDILSTAYDEPFGNSSAIPALFCARKAKEDGVTRLLAGDGGDELFAGNERYATQRLFEHYHRLPSPLRNLLIEPFSRVLPSDRPVLLRKIRRYVEQARLPMPDRLQTYNFLEVFPPSEVFDPDFLATVSTELPRQECREWYARSEDFDFLNRMLVFDWKLTLADNDIRKVNRMCEVAGVDVDYPLLDDELVSFSLQIPSRLKMRRSDLRYAFRKAHEQYLPKAVLEKSKHGFGLPVGEWLRSSDTLRDRILPAIDRFQSRGVIRQDFVATISEKHRDEHAGYFGTMLWLIAVLETWLSSHT